MYIRIEYLHHYRRLQVVGQLFSVRLQFVQRYLVQLYPGHVVCPASPAHAEVGLKDGDNTAASDDGVLKCTQREDVAEEMII